MPRILVPAAAIALLAACGSPEVRNDATPAEPPAANVAVAAPNPAAPASAANGAAAPAAAASTPADTIPRAFEGVYDIDLAACARPSEYRLTVTDRELRFHESIGTVRSVAIESADAIEVAADYQGEGESWSNVRALRLNDAGATLTIAGEGTELRRVRCPPLRG